MNIIRQELKSRLLSTVIWTAIILFFIVVAIIEFSAFEHSGDMVNIIMQQMPSVLRSVFGIGQADLTQFDGYYTMILLYILVMLSIHGLYLGYSILSNEENDNTADFLLTKPTSRNAVVLKKVMAGILIILFMQLTILITQLFVFEEGLMTLNGNSILLYGATQFFFFSLGLFLSQFFREKGDKIGLGLILLFYFYPVIIDLSNRFNSLRKFSFFSWFNEYDLKFISKRFLVVILGLIIVSFVFIGLSMNKFKRKDIL